MVMGNKKTDKNTIFVFFAIYLEYKYMAAVNFFLQLDGDADDH